MPEPPTDLWEPPLDVRGSVRTMDKREAPTYKPAAYRGETVKPAAESASAKPAESRRVLRPLKAWTEAVDRVRATSPMAASFLVSAKAYTTEGGGVVVKLESDFIRSMVSREGAPEALRAALSVCMERKLSEADIQYEVEDAKVRDEFLLDLILEAAEE